MIELSIVMPCLNEAETLAICIKKAKHFIVQQQIEAEIIVADNGSTDGSQQIAQTEGARVVFVKSKGYGNALIGGIQAARGKYVIMGDADDSYDFSALENFLQRLREGYQLVMGNRFKGGIRQGAMPFSHRYLGNPVLSWLGRLFFKSNISDFHCGLRGFCRKSILALDLRTSGMEFASEMVVKATLYQLRITEVPTILYKDGRNHPPHLQSWHDGWRHLRFLLMYSPRWLFLYPGIFLIILGLTTMGILLPKPLIIGNITFNIHTLLLSGTAIILGSQTAIFAVLIRQFAINAKVLPDNPRFSNFIEKISLERLLTFGFFILFLGVIGIFYSIFVWGNSKFGVLNPDQMMRLLVPSITAVAVGFQIAVTGFVKSIIDINIHRNNC